MAQRAQQKAPAPEPPDEDEDAPDEGTSDDLAPRRATNLRKGCLTKRFQLPAGCSIREVAVRELEGHDELTAALWMEQNAPAAMLETPAGQIAAEQRELVRLSLVEVDGEEVNLDGVPFLGMDRWTLKTYKAVRFFYQTVNTLDDGELRKSLAGAVVLAGPAPARGGSAARRG